MRVERDGGAIAVVVALFAVVAFGFAAIIVDLGYARMVKATAQDAADSAALLAAQKLVDGTTPSQAAEAGKVNVDEVLALTVTDLSSVWDCSDAPPISAPSYCASFDEPSSPRQVRVLVSEIPVSSFFGGIFGYGGAEVSASAVASLGPVTFTPECAICVLSDEHAIDGTVNTAAADIFFDGNLFLGPGSKVQADERTVFLGGTLNGDGEYGERLITKVEGVENPLATDTEPEPPEGGPSVITPCLGVPDSGPGVFGAFELGSISTPTCELASGDYVFTGPLTAAPGAVIIGSGVRIWVQADVDLSQARRVNLESSEGSLIYASEGDAVTISLFGAGVVDIEGDINAPGGTVRAGPATDECERATIRGLVVAKNLSVGQNQCLKSTKPTVREIASVEPPVLIR